MYVCVFFSLCKKRKEEAVQVMAVFFSLSGFYIPQEELKVKSLSLMQQLLQSAHLLSVCYELFHCYSLAVFDRKDCFTTRVSHQ